MTARKELKKSIAQSFYWGCASLVSTCFLYWFGNHDIAFLLLALTLAMKIRYTWLDDNLYLELNDRFHELIDQLEKIKNE